MPWRGRSGSPQPPHVDPDGYFASADTIFELAGRIKNPYQKQPISGAVLQETVNRYNSFVTSGVDADFGKPMPLHKIEKPPFYAAWATPILHDSLTGLRTDTARAGDRHSRRGDPRALLRRRIPGRLCPARARALPGVRPHRRPACGAAEFMRRRSCRDHALQSDQPRGVGRADAGGRGRNVLDQGRREIGVRPCAGRPPCRGLRRHRSRGGIRQRSVKRRWPGRRRCTGPRSTCRRRRRGK